MIFYESLGSVLQFGPSCLESHHFINVSENHSLSQSVNHKLQPSFMKQSQLPTHCTQPTQQMFASYFANNYHQFTPDNAENLTNYPPSLSDLKQIMKGRGRGSNNNDENYFLNVELPG